MNQDENFKYQCYNGVYLKPGAKVVCTDRNSMNNYDREGVISNVWRYGSGYKYEIDFGGNIETLMDEYVIASNTDTDEAKLNRLKRSIQVFLSYGNEDKEVARKLHDELMRKEINTWMDERSLIPGEQWENIIRKAITNFHIALIILSSKSLSRKGYLQKEINIADDRSKTDSKFLIIPIRIDNCKIPSKLSKWHWLNFYEENAMDKLMSGLDKHAKDLLPYYIS